MKEQSELLVSNSQIKNNLRELSKAINAYKQALEHAVSEIEFLERRNEQMQMQIEFAFTFPDGSSMTLEELGQDYFRLRKGAGEW